MLDISAGAQINRPRKWRAISRRSASCLALRANARASVRVATARRTSNPAQRRASGAISRRGSLKLGGIKVKRRDRAYYYGVSLAAQNLQVPLAVEQLRNGSMLGAMGDRRVKQATHAHGGDACT